VDTTAGKTARDNVCRWRDDLLESSRLCEDRSSGMGSHVLRRRWAECFSTHSALKLQAIVCICRFTLPRSTVCFVLLVTVRYRRFCLHHEHVLSFGNCGKRHGFSTLIVLAYALNCFYLTRSSEQRSSIASTTRWSQGCSTRLLRTISAKKTSICFESLRVISESVLHT
jgi:hypothetical protein